MKLIKARGSDMDTLLHAAFHEEDTVKMDTHFQNAEAQSLAADQ